MRRSGFKSRHPQASVRDPDRVRPTPTPVPGAFRLSAPVANQVKALPSRVKLRNSAVLALARGEPCMLLIPGLCLGGGDTSVQCHSNLGVHGKGGGTKAHDCCSFSGCAACHFWLDQDGAPSYEQKHAATMAALARQIARWALWVEPQHQGVAHGDTYSDKHRSTAAWALRNLHSLAQSNPHAFDQAVHESIAALPNYCINAITP